MEKSPIQSQSEDARFIEAKKRFRQDIFDGAIGWCEKSLQEHPRLAIMAFNGDGQTALHLAMMSSNRTPAMIDLLLAHEADINARTFSGKSPLMEGVARNSTLECVRYLIERGADVFGKPRGDQRWRSVLHEAAANAQNDMSILLIERGGQELLEDLGPGLMRPIHNAVSKADESTCRLLLRAGADPNAVNESGECPVTMAGQRVQNAHAMTLTLIAYGGKVERSNPSLRFLHFEYTMEMAAAASGDTERLFELHRLRRAQGLAFSDDEMANIDFAARSNNQEETLAVIGSIHAFDAIDDVLKMTSKHSNSMVN